MYIFYNRLHIKTYIVPSAFLSRTHRKTNKQTNTFSIMTQNTHTPYVSVDADRD